MNYDIIIIGAGPVGLSFALSLKHTRLKILLIERSSLTSIRNPKPDGREIALTHLSKDILKKLDCWDYLINHGSVPIEKAQVYDGDSPYALDFVSPNQQPLGFLTPNFQIRRALYDQVKMLKQVSMRCDTSASDIKLDARSATVYLENGEQIQARLAVSADSKFSHTRSKVGIGTFQNDFARTAIVCHLSHEKPHDKTAFECFHYGRTLAILPMAGDKSSAVITVPNALAKSLLAMSPKDFASDVELRLHGKLGQMILASERYSYPLIAVHTKRFIKTRYALLGDASVGMHPVTAHGFNLGLRGANTLAQQVQSAFDAGRDIGSDRVLRIFEIKHMAITKPLYLGTNGIVGFFTNESTPFKLMRSAAIRLANNFAPLKYGIVNSLTESKKLPTHAVLKNILKSPFAK